MQAQSLKNGARMSSTNPTLRTVGQSGGADTLKSRHMRDKQWGTSINAEISHFQDGRIRQDCGDTIHESEAGETEEGAIGVGLSEDET